MECLSWERSRKGERVHTAVCPMFRYVFVNGKQRIGRTEIRIQRAAVRHTEL